jgi:hypothetical protein
VTARAIAALPFPSTGPILVLVAELSKDRIVIDFPCHPAFTPKESRELAGRFRSGEFDSILKWLDWHCEPDGICDECAKPMGGEIVEEDVPSLSYVNLLCLTPFGPKAYFLCDWCLEKWKANDWYVPPMVFAKLEAGIDYRKRADA